MCLATIYCLCLYTIRSICCCILVLAVHSNNSLCLYTIRSICCCILVLAVHSNNSLCLNTIRSICCCILVLTVHSNNSLCLYTTQYMLLYFSTGSTFQPVSNFTGLHGLTQAAHSCALLPRPLIFLYTPCQWYNVISN